MLGVPMGHPTYVLNELAKATHLVQEFCDRLIGLEHPQAAQLLLRFCCGACRVTLLLRTLLRDTMAETAAQIDHHGIDLSNHPWLTHVVTGQTATITSRRFW